MFFQPKVTPLPSGIELHGKTAIITGASAGLGLETARQLLCLKCSTLVLAVRNTTKGESCAEELRQDPVIKTNNPNAIIKVIKLDVDDNASVQTFAHELKRQISTVDYLILNAGLGRISHERSASGHERSLQVNYLSNVLLLAELLPYLNDSAERKGSPVRVTWIGSRGHQSNTSFEMKAPIRDGESVFGRFDNEAAFLPWASYADSKLLCAMFMYELSPRLDGDKIILNMICPGMLRTGMGDFLPLPLRVIVGLLVHARGRPVEIGGILVVNAAVVVGEESHGRHMGDKEILEVSKYIQSPAGHVVQKKVWEETIVEMRKITALPVEFR
ncbi:Short-chain dehydrogenase/reductase SDR [Penicillium angulare]|uniref:Short-chain dehydrogenase/reductase SDR n=1 Tax=Penicillium angulare TaxID=116970 RepID=UPI00253FF140|nr:Short-chain dehydrogenase/reductase SDR [Penicillium angulare]KAJ5279140.1 Short-chain dehydrogenase/reductase SDR [Penicillium angulare]